MNALRLYIDGRLTPHFIFKEKSGGICNNSFFRYIKKNSFEKCSVNLRRKVFLYFWSISFFASVNQMFPEQGLENWCCNVKTHDLLQMTLVKKYLQQLLQLTDMSNLITWCCAKLCNRKSLLTYGGREIVGCYHQCQRHSPIYFPPAHTNHVYPA